MSALIIGVKQIIIEILQDVIAMVTGYGISPC